MQLYKSANHVAAAQCKGSCRYSSNALVNKEMCDLCHYNNGMDVVTRRANLNIFNKVRISREFHIQLYIEFTQNDGVGGTE